MQLALLAVPVLVVLTIVARWLRRPKDDDMDWPEMLNAIRKCQGIQEQEPEDTTGDRARRR